MPTSIGASPSAIVTSQRLPYILFPVRSVMQTQAKCESPPNARTTPRDTSSPRLPGTAKGATAQTLELSELQWCEFRLSRGRHAIITITGLPNRLRNGLLRLLPGHDAAAGGHHPTRD